MKRQCNTCAAWSPDDSDGSLCGLCRRKSPFTVDSNGIAKWPETLYEDGCLEWIRT